MLILLSRGPAHALVRVSGCPAKRLSTKALLSAASFMKASVIWHGGTFGTKLLLLLLDEEKLLEEDDELLDELEELEFEEEELDEGGHMPGK
jgi:hypothetical protein